MPLQGTDLVSWAARHRRATNQVRVIATSLLVQPVQQRDEGAARKDGRSTMNQRVLDATRAMVVVLYKAS